MKLYATTAACRAEGQGPGRVLGAVLPGPMDAPCANSRKGTAAFVAQEATFNLDKGRTLWQGEAALTEDAIKSTAPHDAQALINMRCSGSALNPSEVTVPSDRVSAGHGNRGQQGRIPRA